MLEFTRTIYSNSERFPERLDQFSKQNTATGGFYNLQPHAWIEQIIRL